MSDDWKDIRTERKQLRSFKSSYLKSGKDIIKQSAVMKECREILNKALHCSKSDNEEKVKYAFDVLKTWEQLRFPETDILRNELKVDEYAEYYKAIQEGYKENDRFKMYFGNTFANDPALLKDCSEQFDRIKEQMVKYIENGMEKEKAIKKLRKMLKHSFLNNVDPVDDGSRFGRAEDEVNAALNNNPFMNPEVQINHQERIGAKKIIRKLYAHLDKKQERDLARIKQKYRNKIFRIGRMAKSGELWLYNGSIFGIKVSQVDDLIHFRRKKLWADLRKFPVAIIEMKEFNREFLGLADYLILKCYMHRPIRKYKANRIFSRIDTNIFPMKKYEAFEILLGNNKLNQALMIKNSFGLSKADPLSLKLDMEKRIRNYQAYENLFE